MSSCEAAQTNIISSTLPIDSAKKEIISHLITNNILILIGDTGSGKTTKVARFFYEHFSPSEIKICCTQPRRIAAIAVAKRVATELRSIVGDIIGYNVRFEKCYNSETRVKYLTEGILLNEFISDPLLNCYNLLIIDEVHERTINTDLLLGLTKELLKFRYHLRLIIMSATLEMDKFFNYFWKAKSLMIPGRSFRVELFYVIKPEKNYLKTALTLVFNITKCKVKGGILIFLTGEDEIESFCENLSTLCNFLNENLGIFPLYANLSSKYHDDIFNSYGDKSFLRNRRKVVASTNIAETSITIKEIVFVIDTGFSKKKVYNPRVNIDSLLISTISKASAHQRSGRAGRMSSGKCFRLFTEFSYLNEMENQSYPEIMKSNMISMIIMMKKMGIDDLVRFDFIDPPSPESMIRGLENLNLLGIINKEGSLTNIGFLVGEFPIDPKLSLSLINSSMLNCSSEIITIISMIDCRYVLKYTSDIKIKSTIHKLIINKKSDHITLLNLYNAWRSTKKSRSWVIKNKLNYKLLDSADNIRINIIKRCHILGMRLRSTFEKDIKILNNIKKCLLCGYFTNIAVKRVENLYITIKDKHHVIIHPNSTVEILSTYIIFESLLFSKLLYTCINTNIKQEWLLGENS
mmetsp:Transcript_33759/g.81802  ORF Transcript_33759/g.81802 Transcript_33759/m.81802 type:complete len:634 (+) Transcript_33759:704-2605(+)